MSSRLNTPTNGFLRRLELGSLPRGTWWRGAIRLLGQSRPWRLFVQFLQLSWRNMLLEEGMLGPIGGSGRRRGILTGKLLWSFLHIRSRSCLAFEGHTKWSCNHSLEPFSSHRNRSLPYRYSWFQPIRPSVLIHRGWKTHRWLWGPSSEKDSISPHSSDFRTAYCRFEWNLTCRLEPLKSLVLGLYSISPLLGPLHIFSALSEQFAIFRHFLLCPSHLQGHFLSTNEPS